VLQLASTSLPVGAFSYSQGLEWAIEAGLVHDEATANQWLATTLDAGVGAWDATWVARLVEAWHQEDPSAIQSLCERFLASRETRELYAETRQMGRSMLELLRDDASVPAPMLALLERLEEEELLAYPAAWTALACHRGVGIEDAVIAYLWAWLESAVLAALKAIPLGQKAGQRLLLALGARLDDIATRAIARPLDACSNLLPGFTLASMHHETQYTRLFRS
jgi:urease accessory protein